MDTLAEDQALQAVLDAGDLGIDNDALEFEIDEYINGDGSICLPDDLPGVSFDVNGRLSDCAVVSDHNSSNGNKPGSSTITSTATTTFNLPPDLHHSHPMIHHPQHHPLSHPQHHQLNHQQHQQQQCQLQPSVTQQQQQLQLQQLSSSSSGGPGSMYNCGIGVPAQGRVGFEHHQHHQQQQHHHLHHNTPLPDSPPDSGSEPYSPQDDTPHSLSDNSLKHCSLSGGMPSVPQPLYPGSQQRVPALPDLGLGHKMPPAYLVAGHPEPPKLNHMPPGPQGGGVVPPGMSHQMSPPISHPFLPHHFASMTNLANQPTKKRKYSDSPTNTLTAAMLPPSVNGVLSIKQEPPGAALSQFTQYVEDCSTEDDFSYDLDSNLGFVDGTYQVIKWTNFNSSGWNTLTDANFKDLPVPTYRVDADKGFNFSVPDEAFVCQKKNHFQVTVHIGLQGVPKYVRTPDGVKKIEEFYVHFHGVKMESVNQLIKIEQSQSDRSKKPFHPVKVDLMPEQVKKLTVGRLHFSETTSNNMRKKGKPNPDQRYFKLVVALQAQSGQSSYLICAHSSERIIVRASNPGQFDSEVDVMWQKGHTGESVYHVGRVGINTDHPDEALTVHGNVKLTGHLLQPSDMRAKENIEEINPRDQLENVQKMRIYRYEYKEEFAEGTGIPLEKRQDAGVLAQELRDVLPDAVQSTGDIRLANGNTLENFLVVNKDRIFMENVGAVKELCKLTDNLEVRIDELEKMNKRLSKLRRYDSIKSTYSFKSITSTISTVSSTAPPPKNTSNTSSIGNNNTSRTTNASSVSNGSSGSSRSHSHHHGRHHCHRRASSSTTSSFAHLPKMCGNRFLQITILILILIMAFCLIAITTLYIMERHKQTSDSYNSPIYQESPRTQPPAHTTHRPSGGNGSSRIQPHSEAISTSPSSSSPPAATTSTTTTPLPSVISTTKAPEQKTTELVREGAPQSTVVTVLPTLPPFPIPMCQKEECEQLCCPMPAEDQPIIYVHNGDEGGEVPYMTNNESGGGEEEIPAIDTTASHHQNTVVSMSQTSTGNNNNNNNNSNNNNIQVVISNSGPAYNVINAMAKSNNIHNIYKRQADEDNGADVELVIKELNVSIDHRYCQSGCSGNNQTYFIQMAPLFGYEPITLQFRMNKSRHVALCRSQSLAHCPDVTASHPEQRTQNGTRVEWSLSVGVSFRTNLRFRVAEGHGIPDDNTNELCTLRPTAGLMIKDYTLRFQRSCPSNS